VGLGEEELELVRDAVGGGHGGVGVEEGDFLSFTTKETMAQWNARIGLFIWAFPDSAGS
jgi:hypothetical protein